LDHRTDHPYFDQHLPVYRKYHYCKDNTLTVFQNIAEHKLQKFKYKGDRIMKKIRTTAAILTAVCALSLIGCGAKSTSATAVQSGTKADPTIVKVGVVGEYNAQWDTINTLLSDDGIQIELVKFTDYAAPNRALNDGEIDLNAFQHKAFLANDMQSARKHQTEANRTIEVILRNGVLPSSKALLTMLGLDVGLCREPFLPLTDAMLDDLRANALPLLDGAWLK
jgi:hypothetical protein